MYTNSLPESHLESHPLAIMVVLWYILHQVHFGPQRKFFQLWIDVELSKNCLEVASFRNCMHYSHFNADFSRLVKNTCLAVRLGRGQHSCPWKRSYDLSWLDSHDAKRDSLNASLRLPFAVNEVDIAYRTPFRFQWMQDLFESPDFLVLSDLINRRRLNSPLSLHLSYSSV